MSSESPSTATLPPNFDRSAEFVDDEDQVEASTQKNSESSPDNSDRDNSGTGVRRGRLLLWLTGTTTAGYAISAFVHSLLIVGLSVVVLPGMSGAGDVSTLVSVSDTEQVIVGGIDRYEFETRIDLEGGGRIEEQLPSVPDPDLLGVEEILKGIRSEVRFDPLLSQNNGQGEGEQQGDGSMGGSGGFAMPASGKVVTKGSFTAWTIPEDPGPKENYLIVIQVKLPPKYKSMPFDDVTGLVVGTDGYRLRINAHTSKYLNKTRQVVVRIPGAESQIRDTIHVRSQILKEEQDLTIEF